MRNVSDKWCRENQNTHFVFSNLFFENRAVYEKMWKNIVQTGRSQMTIWCMCIACWISKATNTHSGCVILTDFPQQQWLHERASMLRYMYIRCIVTKQIYFALHCDVGVVQRYYDTANVQLTVSQQTTGTKFMRFYVSLEVSGITQCRAHSAQDCSHSTRFHITLSRVEGKKCGRTD